MNRNRCAGFTLVELLVVIGVIALLISILVPSLNRAREASMRLKCASNLRQVGLAYQIYANVYKDYAPLGYINNGTLQKNWNYGANYYVTALGSTRTCGAGWMVDARIVRDFQAFYCPSEIWDQWAYQGSQITPNPWPFTKTLQTRIGYGYRPIVGWVPPTSSLAPWKFIDENGRPAALPKWSHQKNLAVLTEVMVNKTNLNTRHKQGINVLYGNGAVKWVPRGQFLYTSPKASGLMQVPGTNPNDTSSFTSNGHFFLQDTVPAQGFWGDSDRF